MTAAAEQAGRSDAVEAAWAALRGSTALSARNVKAILDAVWPIIAAQALAGHRAPNGCDECAACREQDRAQVRAQVAQEIAQEIEEAAAQGPSLWCPWSAKEAIDIARSNAAPDEAAERTAVAESEQVWTGDQDLHSRVRQVLSELRGEVDASNQTHNPDCECEWDAGVLTAVDRVQALIDPGHTGAAAPRRYRTGRKVGRTIYRQRGDQPGDRDELIGTLDTRELAAIAVDAMNGAAGVRAQVAEEIAEALDKLAATTRAHHVGAEDYATAYAWAAMEARRHGGGCALA